MKLHWSPRSPFVRKVMIAAHETGVINRLDCVRTVAATTRPHLELMADNPLSKIPTLLRDDGAPLYDLVVICEYFDSLHDGAKLFPVEPQARWTALRRHALGNGLIEMLLLWRGERLREHPARVYLDTFAVKYAACVAALAAEAPALAATPFGIGHIAIGCALSYSDFRFAELDWRRDHARLADWHAAFLQRPSVRATQFAEG